MQITKELLEILREKQQEHSYYDAVRPLFVSGKFNHGNWYGGDDIIRQYFRDYVYMDTEVFDVDFIYNNINFWGDMIITHTWHEDQNYSTITFSGMIEIHGILQPDKYQHTAFISWYKNRGTTESVKFDGKLMTEDEYLFILNALQETGFEFDLN